ncbi:MAG: peptide ABC transporter substrate-binding protein [Erysipelotrichaceae bacterium]|nr:peptide ABC transporter substrate-binding protein [Erysipelotrichaceae bacterium]
MKKSKLILVFGLIVSLLVGCSNGSSSGSNTTTPTTDGSNTKSAVIATDVDLSTMDHHIATDGTSFIAISLVLDGLVELDEKGFAIPDLAKSWDISDDGLVYTFHLDDANWSNGEPITANDFVFGWQRLASPETASEYNYLVQTLNIVNADGVVEGTKPLEDLGVKALDDKTLEVTLDIPTDFFLGMMAFPSFFPLNQEFYEEKGDLYSTSSENLLYCGPYVMESWTSGNSFSFIKNDDYFNKNDETVNRVEFKFIQDTQSAMLEYQSGNLDVVKLSGEMVDAYNTEEGFRERLQGYLWYLSINRLEDKLTNNNLLQALSFGVDRETIAVNVLKDGSIAAEGIVPVNLATSPSGVDYREDAGSLLSYDPEKAGEYYEAAKAELGGDVTLELLFEDSEASKAVAEYIQNNWETNLPGITINLNMKPKKTRLEVMRLNEFEIGLTRWGPDYADPQTYLDLFLEGPSHGRYSNAEYFKLIYDATKGKFASDSQARWDALKEAEKILVNEEIGAIPVYQNGGAMMINPKLTGIEFHIAAVDNYRNMVKAD